MIAAYNTETDVLEIFEKENTDGGWVISQPSGMRYWVLTEFPEFGGEPQLIGMYGEFGDAYARAKELT